VATKRTVFGTIAREAKRMGRRRQPSLQRPAVSGYFGVSDLDRKVKGHCPYSSQCWFELLDIASRKKPYPNFWWRKVPCLPLV
jgi:hypothetical protein